MKPKIVTRTDYVCQALHHTHWHNWSSFQTLDEAEAYVAKEKAKEVKTHIAWRIVRSETTTTNMVVAEYPA